MRTVVFDLDGTLADTGLDLIAAANASFRARGFGDVLDPVADYVTAFSGGRAMLRLGARRLSLDESFVEEEYLRFLEFYDATIHVETRLYPGVVEAIERLQSDGYTTTVCTNKPEALANKLLSLLSVRALFPVLIGADTLPVRKPDPAPYVAAVERAGGAIAHSVLIGDSKTDRDTARAADVPIVLVEFGPLGDKVASMNPDAILPNYDALNEVVSGLIG